jgi:predicted RNase H-like nuclease (RuvC/YqgF family)
MQNEVLQDQVDSMKRKCSKLQADLLEKELTIEFLRKELKGMYEDVRLKVIERKD